MAGSGVGNRVDNMAGSGVGNRVDNMTGGGVGNRVNNMAGNRVNNMAGGGVGNRVNNMAGNRVDNMATSSVGNRQARVSSQMRYSTMVDHSRVSLSIPLADGMEAMEPTVDREGVVGRVGGVDVVWVIREQRISFRLGCCHSGQNENYKHLHIQDRSTSRGGLSPC